MKVFSEELIKFINKIDNRENFAFSRFSDGELFILENKSLELKDDCSIINGIRYPGSYKEEEGKSFLPEKHQKNRELLFDSLSYSSENYYKGITCPCCGGLDAVKFMVRHSNLPIYSDNLTWANLFLNSNYPTFVKEVIPRLESLPLIIVANKKVDTSYFPNVMHHFKIGNNCFINDLNIIEEIKTYITKNKITSTYFLISASSLSNLIIKELNQFEPENTYLDIGSILNPLFKLNEWQASRDYLRQFWLSQPGNFLERNCYWPNLIMIPNNQAYWEFIRNLRNSDREHFVDQKEISREEQTNYMARYNNNYYITLLDNNPVGYLGYIDDDVRIAVTPSSRRLGVGSFMITKFLKKNKKCKAKVLNSNNASLTLFSSLGFTEIGRDETFTYFLNEK